MQESRACLHLLEGAGGAGHEPGGGREGVDGNGDNDEQLQVLVKYSIKRLIGGSVY